MANEKHEALLKQATQTTQANTSGIYVNKEYVLIALQLLQSEHDERMNAYEMANKIINDDLKETIRQLTQEVERLKGKPNKPNLDNLFNVIE